MHHPGGVLDRRAQSIGRTAGDARRAVGGEPRIRRCRQRRELGEQPLGLTARGRLAIAGLPSGIERAIAGLDRVIERETQVTLGDGIVVALKGTFGRLELLPCVDRRIGRARRGQRPFGLMTFLGGRLRARGERQHGQEDPCDPTHAREYSAAMADKPETMRDLAARDRPREKLDRSGVTALGDNELLAVLIGHGTAGVSALAIANRLLTTAGGLHGLTRMSRDQIATVPGLGSVKASRVQAAVELGRRTLLLSPRARPRFLAPIDLALYLLPLYGAYPVERLGILLLDTRHRLLREHILSVGGLDGTLASPRDVFRSAIAAGAAAVVLFHNHPSGDPTPSDDDRTLTRRLAQAGDIVGIPLLDHVILADTQYWSMKQAREL